MSLARRTFLGVLLSGLERLALAADADAAAPIAALNRGLLNAMHAGKATPFPQCFTALAPLVEGGVRHPGHPAGVGGLSLGLELLPKHGKSLLCTH